MASDFSPGSDDAIAVMITAGSEAEAIALAQALVEEAIAACVAITPITSIYRWQGKIEQANEWQLVVKTTQGQWPKLVERVSSLHSYDVPEIIALPIVAGSSAYLSWLKAST
jgi:periplasmic divalent cation tolerance protein